MHANLYVYRLTNPNTSGKVTFYQGGPFVGLWYTGRIPANLNTHPLQAVFAPFRLVYHIIGPAGSESLQTSLGSFLIDATMGTGTCANGSLLWIMALATILVMTKPTLRAIVGSKRHALMPRGCNTSITRTMQHGRLKNGRIWWIA
jgi:hypothetical protein